MTSSWWWVLPALLVGARVMSKIFRTPATWLFYAGGLGVTVLCVVAGALRMPYDDRPFGCDQGGGLECVSSGPGLDLLLSGLAVLGTTVVIALVEVGVWTLLWFIDPQPAGRGPHDADEGAA